MRLQVGVETSCKAPPRVELLKLRLAERLGARTLLLPDHLMSATPASLGAPPGRLLPASDAFLDPFVMLGTMAARFRRVRLGTGVTDAVRRHPATLAQAAVTLDHLSRGRAILGIGTGAPENIAPWGLPRARRAARLDEALAVIRALWGSHGEPVDFDGAVWRLRRALFATPLHRGTAPPIWVAAHAPAMLRLVGRWADGWYPTVKMSPAEYAAGLATIQSAAAEAGRTLGRFEPALQVFLVLGSERRRVLEAGVRSPAALPLLLALPAALWRRHGLAHPLGERQGFGDFLPEEVTAATLDAARRAATPALLGDGVVAGSPAEVVAEIRALVAAGLRHVVLANVGPGLTGAGPADVLRLGLVVRRLGRIALPSSR